MAKHWTQTRAGKKKMSALQTARWAASRNGASSDSLDEFRLMEQILQLWAKLPDREKDYIRERIA